MKRWLNFGLGALVLVMCARAASTIPEAEASGILVGQLAEGTPYERLMSAPVLYQNEAHPWVQQLALVGQLQMQYARGSDDSGNFGTSDLPADATWSNIEVRRFRLGMKGRLFRKLYFLNLTDLYPDFSPRIYKRIPETYLTWMHNEAFNISAGKCELKFDREQEYSSRDFPVFERTALGNMFYAGELTGAWICGENIAGGWLYFLGAYSNERRDEWTRFDGGAILLSKIGYDYARQSGLDFARLKLQWLHNTDPGFAATADCLPSPSYSDCFSLSNEIKTGKLGFTAEFLWGNGTDGRPDTGGFSTMTSWAFNQKIELINVIELAASSGENGIVLPGRYEALASGAGDRKGDGYAACYTGLNYYIDGHRLKLMSGAKYSRLEGGPGGGDFDGWTWLAGLRMAF